MNFEVDLCCVCWRKVCGHSEDTRSHGNSEEYPMLVARYNTYIKALDDLSKKINAMESRGKDTEELEDEFVDLEDELNEWKELGQTKNKDIK